MDQNADPNIYSFSGNGVRFDVSLDFSFSGGHGIGKSVIIFGVDNSLSAHVDNKSKHILILWKSLL